MVSHLQSFSVGLEHGFDISSLSDAPLLHESETDSQVGEQVSSSDVRDTAVVTANENITRTDARDDV